MNRALLALAALLAFLPGPAHPQSTLLQGGSWTTGHVPTYSISGGAQPIVQDSGPAGGNTTGQGLSELNITARGTGTAPYAAQGTGPLGTLSCLQDAVSTNSTGYHYLCFSANAQGGGLITYGAGGPASVLPLNFIVNGTTYAFPFPGTGTVTGPSTSVVNDVACWNNTSGTLLKDCGTISTTPGGSSGQVQYNNAGAFGGFTLGGDGTLNTGTGALTVSKIGGVGISLAGTLTTAGQFTTSGAFALQLTTTNATNVTLPTSGTLATLAGSEAFTNKTYNGNSWTAGTGTLTIAASKTLTVSNTLTFAGTDGSTLNVGTGGTLGSAAFTAASAYVPSGTQITNSLSGDVALNNTSNYFTGPSIAQGTIGTWCAWGTVSVTDSSNAVYNAKLWDGTTVIASAAIGAAVNQTSAISLSGCLASPAGNIRISVKDASNTSGTLLFNASGNSKDSTLSAIRVQ